VPLAVLWGLVVNIVVEVVLLIVVVPTVIEDMCWERSPVVTTTLGSLPHLIFLYSEFTLCLQFQYNPPFSFSFIKTRDFCVPIDY
jgi:hypothetical protein